MASNRFNLQDVWVGLIKLVLGVAIALLLISLAGAATARYFLTQLSTLPERPVYDNDTPAQKQATSPKAAAAPQKTQTVVDESAASEPPDQTSETEALYKAIVTYPAGLLMRTGAGADYGTVDGIDYEETVEVLEESGRWYKVRTANGVEGWIKGQGNTQKL